MEDYTEELAAANTVRKQDASFSLEACRKLARDVWGEFIISEEEAHEGF